MIGIKLVRIPRRIRSEDVNLRLFRLRDLSALSGLFQEHMSGGSRATGAVPKNLWAFRQWVYRTFQLLYLIERKADKKTTIHGFIGLYNIRLGENLCLSMGIFDPKDRGHRLGSKALQALLDNLGKCGAANTIQAQVAQSNLASIHLFDKLGFDICERSEDDLVMKRSIGPTTQRHWYQ